MKGTGVIVLIGVVYSACIQYYSVVSGDTCWQISNRFSVTLDQFRAMNPGINCDNLQIGQSVCVKEGSGPQPTGNVTYDQFSQALTMNGYQKPRQDQYSAFIRNYKTKGGISSLRELAMFLAEIMWESGGLIYKEEIRCKVTHCPNDYRSPGDPADKFYYGRGYIQLTWSYNYKSASKYLFGDEGQLYWNPDRVASDEELSWNTAFWFWKFNVHSDQGVQNGQFGSATNRINGDQECHPCRGACNNRFGLYKNVLKAFNIQETPNPAGC